MTWVKLPPDDAIAAAVTEAHAHINEQALEEWLVDLHCRLRDAFPTASDAEITAVIAQVPPIVRAHEEQRIRDILRRQRH